MNPISKVKNSLAKRELRKIIEEMSMNSKVLSGVGAILVGVVLEAAKEVVNSNSVDLLNWKSALSAFLVALAVGVAHRLDPPKVK